MSFYCKKRHTFGAIFNQTNLFSHYTQITCFSGCDEGGGTGRPPTYIIDRDDVHFILSVRTKISNRVVHGDDPRDFTKRLVGIFWLELDDIILKIFRSIVGPTQPDGSSGDFGNPNIARWSR